MKFSDSWLVEDTYTNGQSASIQMFSQSDGGRSSALFESSLAPQ